MKIVADEGIEVPIVVRLRAEGHVVIHIAEVAPGSADSTILSFAHQEEALLITFDKDFGDLVFYKNQSTYGVVLVRLLDTLSSVEKAEIVADVINEYQEELLHSFTVITDNKKRIVRLLPQQSHPEVD